MLFEYLNAWKMLIPLAPLRIYLDLVSPPDWDPGRDPAPLSADFTIVVVFLDVCERCSWCRGRGGAPRPNACVLSPNLFLAPLVRGEGGGQEQIVCRPSAPRNSREHILTTERLQKLPVNNGVAEWPRDVLQTAMTADGPCSVVFPPNRIFLWSDGLKAPARGDWNMDLGARRWVGGRNSMDSSWPMRF